MDCSLPGSSVHGIFQVRILEGDAISFSRDLPGLGRPRDWTESPALLADSLLLSHQGSPILLLYIQLNRFNLTNDKSYLRLQSESESEVAQSCLTLRPVAYQAPPSTEFSRQEYWSRLPFPSPGDYPDPGIELRSPELQADTLPPETPGKPSHT